MKHLFVSYEIAKLLKEKGFDEECFSSFRNGIHTMERTLLNYPEYIKAPLYQQVIDWFLSKRIFISITFRESKTHKVEGINSVYFDMEIYTLSQGDAFKIYKFEQYSDNYYQALDKAILEALKLI